MSRLRKRLANMNKGAEDSQVLLAIYQQMAMILIEMYNKAEVENKKLIKDFIQLKLNLDLDSSNIKLITDAFKNLSEEEIEEILAMLFPHRYD